MLPPDAVEDLVHRRAEELRHPDALRSAVLQRVDPAVPLLRVVVVRLDDRRARRRRGHDPGCEIRGVLLRDADDHHVGVGGGLPGPHRRRAGLRGQFGQRLRVPGVRHPDLVPQGGEPPRQRAADHARTDDPDPHDRENQRRHGAYSPRGPWVTVPIGDSTTTAPESPGTMCPVGAAANGWQRAALGLGAGSAATLTVALTLGLATGAPFGVEDNGDGYRLYCGVGLIPRTLDRLGAWKGGVVTDFAVGPSTCLSTPSSAGLVLRAAALGHGGSLSLVTVAWWYAVLVGAGRGRRGVGGLGVGDCGARRCWSCRSPRSHSCRSRVSSSPPTASRPGCSDPRRGLRDRGVAGHGPEHRGARTVALLVTALGGGIAATAKVAYVPVLVVAVVACAAVSVGRRRPRRLSAPRSRAHGARGRRARRRGRRFPGLGLRGRERPRRRVHPRADRARARRHGRARAASGGRRSPRRRLLQTDPAS